MSLYVIITIITIITTITIITIITIITLITIITTIIIIITITTIIAIIINHVNHYYYVCHRQVPKYKKASQGMIQLALTNKTSEIYRLLSSRAYCYCYWLHITYYT